MASWLQAQRIGCPTAPLAIPVDPRMVSASFFDWFARQSSGGLGFRFTGLRHPPSEVSGVFWILPLVGVRRCLSRVVGLS